MAARGYTTKALVAAELGVTFTNDQQTQCDALIEEVESYIDRITARSWIVASPATETLAVSDDGVVYLSNRPVAAITSVAVRSATIGATSTTLTAGSEYELLDATNGILLVGAGGQSLATVVYTHTNAAAALPKDIQRAATMLAAAWMSPRLHPERDGLDALSVFSGEVSMKMSARESAAPPEVLALLKARTRMVFA